MSPKRGRKKSELRRKPPRRLPSPFLLIVCEGKKTEPNYFRGIADKKKTIKGQIKIVTGEKIGGTDPETLFGYAKRERRGRQKEQIQQYDTVWLVIDKDNFSQYEEVIRKAADQKNIQVAYSNPCIEFWFILHFHYRDTPMSGDQAENELNRNKGPLCGYEKKWEDVYQKIEHLTDTAVWNAKKLEQYHREVGESLFSNPSSAMYKLVEILLSLKDDHRK